MTLKNLHEKKPDNPPRVDPFKYINSFIEQIRLHLRVSLFANSYYLMANTAANSLLGFAFWVVAARFFAAADVGIASALIAASVLLAGLSSLGLGAGLIRHLPHAGESSRFMLDSVLSFVALSSLLFVAVFLVGLPLWSPSLAFMYHRPILLFGFLLVVLVLALGGIINQVFIAHRMASYTLIRSLLMSVLRIIFLVVFALFFHSLGVPSIFAAIGIALVVSWLFASLQYLPRLHPDYLPRPRLNGQILGDLIPYSLTNYIASFIIQAPLMVLPILILYLLGPEQNAYSYVVWMLASALFMISGSISLSTFAEGSNQAELLSENVRRALTLTLLLTIPAILLFFLAGEKILMLFGEQYSENGLELLMILAISALPVGLNSIYLAKIKVTKELRTLLALSLFTITSFLVLSCFLIPLQGIAGAGLSWLISQTTLSGIIFLLIWRRGNLKSLIFWREVG